MPSAVASQAVKISIKPRSVKQRGPAASESEFDKELEKARPKPAPKSNAKKPEPKKKGKIAARKFETNDEPPAHTVDRGENSQTKPQPQAPNPAPDEAVENAHVSVAENPTAESDALEKSVEPDAAVGAAQIIVLQKNAKSRAKATNAPPVADVRPVQVAREAKMTQSVQDASGRTASPLTDEPEDANLPSAAEQDSQLQSHAEDAPRPSIKTAQPVVAAVTLGESKVVESDKPTADTTRSAATSAVQMAQAAMQELANIDAEIPVDVSPSPVTPAGHHDSAAHDDVLPTI